MPSFKPIYKVTNLNKINIEGTIVVRSIGFGKSIEVATDEAESNAIKIVLFRGLPDSEQKSAMIGTNESEILNNNKEYFNRFFTDKRYKTFIISSVPVTDFIRKKGGKKSITIDVKINIEALRIDLEQSKVIRKFGF